MECIGCGYCCLKARCGVSMEHYDTDQKRCPGLVWSDNEKRYFCLLMRYGDKTYPSQYFKDTLYEGEGCSSGLNTWRRDVKFRG